MLRMFRLRPGLAGLLLTWIAILLISSSALAQGTAFTYQGKLTDAGNPANGTYDMQFKLFDTPTVGTGTQQGPTRQNPSVQVAGGSFNVILNFGVCALCFDGSARFLEIGVRPAGSPDPYTILAPRQPITSSPYAIQTVNAQQLGGLSASRYVATDANGNVGIGTPNSTVSTPNSTVSPTNLTARLTVSGAGLYNAPGAARFDLFNTTANTGFLQHVTNTGLWQIATTAGETRMVINPSGNIGIGTLSPLSKLHIQSAVADLPPRLQSSGTTGLAAGWEFYLGTTPKGYVGAPDSSSAIAPGEMLVFGGPGTKTSLWAGGNRSVTIDTNGNVGIGSSPSFSKLYAFNENNLLAAIIGENNFANGVGVAGYAFGSNGKAINGINPGGYAGYFDGLIGMTTLASAVGGPALCYNISASAISFCSSSLRYKKEFQPFADGLSFINQLRPISFKWKSNDAPDIGFGAEDVEKINPLFVTYNQKGEIEGVKYDRLSVIFVNAFKEQQAQINAQRTLLEQQQTLIKRQRQQLESLTKIICQLQPQAAICQEAKP